VDCRVQESFLGAPGWRTVLPCKRNSGPSLAASSRTDRNWRFVLVALSLWAESSSTKGAQPASLAVSVCSAGFTASIQPRLRPPQWRPFGVLGDMIHLLCAQGCGSLTRAAAIFRACIRARRLVNQMVRLVYSWLVFLRLAVLRECSRRTVECPPTVAARSVQFTHFHDALWPASALRSRYLPSSLVSGTPNRFLVKQSCQAGPQPKCGSTPSRNVLW